MAQYKYLSNNNYWIIPGTKSGLRSRVGHVDHLIVYEKETAPGVWEEVGGYSDEIVSGGRCRMGVRDGNWMVDIELTSTGFDGTEDTDWKNIGEIEFSFSSYCTPLNVEVVQITGGNRVLWEQNVKCIDADGFEVWVSIDGAERTLLDTVALPDLSYDDMVDYAGSQVTYSVRSYKGTTYSAFSDESEIVIEPDIENLAVTWVDDYAALTFDGVSGWETEVYDSKDNVTFTLMTTLADGVNSYNAYTWQGTTAYFRLRAKKGAEYGDYATINIVTPLVFKFDANPQASVSFSFVLSGGTVRVLWGTVVSGNATYTDYNTVGTNNASYSYGNAGEQIDPAYVKISGSVANITELTIISDAKKYGDLSKWVLPALTKLYLAACGFTGDISAWVLPSGLVDMRIYGNGFAGDLTNWTIGTSASTVMYLNDTDGKNEFTAPPRGNCHQCEASAAGLYMRHCAVSTAILDAWFAWFNGFLVANTPVRNTLLRLDGTGMGVPTGGNNNTDRLAIIAKYVAAGYSATIYNNT